MWQIHPFLFFSQLEAEEKQRYGLENPATGEECSLFSEILVYLPRCINLPFRKNYLPSGFTSSEGERWLFIWEGTQVSLSYFPSYI